MPARSIARTLNRCAPLARLEYAFGEGHPANAAESSLQRKREPASDDEKVKLAFRCAIVPEGPEVIVVSGRVVSTVKVRLAGVGSVLPVWSVALTLNR